MSIRVSCSCSKRFDVPGKYAGKNIRCPSCSAVIQVPSQEVATQTQSRTAHIVGKCECGKQLSAKPELAGKSVRCPACKNVVRIPESQSRNNIPGKINVVCSCGNKIAAKSELAGKAVRCPRCQVVIRIPSKEPELTSPTFENQPENFQNDSLDDLFDDDSDPLADSVNLSHLSPRKKRAGHTVGSFDLKWIYWAIGGTAALILLLFTVQSLMKLTQTAKPKEQVDASSSNKSDIEKDRETESHPTRTSGSRILNPHPKVEAILARWNDSTEKNKLKNELKQVGERATEHVLYYAHLYFLEYERQFRKEGRNPHQEEYGPKLRLTIAAHSAARMMDPDNTTRKRVFAETGDPLERILMAHQLASRYAASSSNTNVPELRKLLPIQRKGLQSNDRFARLFAVNMTEHLGDLAKPNRDLIERIAETTNDEELKQAASRAISHLTKRVARLEKPNSVRPEARPQTLQPAELDVAKEDFQFLKKKGVVFTAFPEPDSDWAFEGMLPEYGNAANEFDSRRFYVAIVYTNALFKHEDLDRFESLSSHLLGFGVGMNRLQGSWKLDDRAVQKICRNKKLKQLNLNLSAISASGLQYINELPELIHLNLQRVPVGDECMEYIVSRPKLEFLDLRGTRVSIAAAKQLHEQRPRMLILHHGNQEGGFSRNE